MSPIKTIAAIAITVAASHALAQANWVDIYNSDEFTYYIDKTSIKKVAKNMRVWSLIDYKKPKKNGRFTANSYVSLTEYDCADEKSITLKQTMYSGNMGAGDNSPIDLIGERWDYITPNTINESVFKAVCGK